MIKIATTHSERLIVAELRGLLVDLGNPFPYFDLPGRQLGISVSVVQAMIENGMLDVLGLWDSQVVW